MTLSFAQIYRSQHAWAERSGLSIDRRGYVDDLNANLALGALDPKTRSEFDAADGSELRDTASRPAKMRSLVSSSALAVNFFDFWRSRNLTPLQTALGLEQSIHGLEFEYKCNGYPVGPRTANLDLLLRLVDGTRIAIESKFAEPFRTPGVDSPLSLKYHPPGVGLWESRGLTRTQALVDRLRGEWDYLDVPQLLKHILGLRSEQKVSPVCLIYLWFDTGLEDATAHRKEVDRFKTLTERDEILFTGISYQEIFSKLVASDVHSDGWSNYMKQRYFADLIHRTD